MQLKFVFTLQDGLNYYTCLQLSVSMGLEPLFIRNHDS